MMISNSTFDINSLVRNMIRISSPATPPFARRSPRERWRPEEALWNDTWYSRCATCANLVDDLDITRRIVSRRYLTLGTRFCSIDEACFGIFWFRCLITDIIRRCVMIIVRMIFKIMHIGK
jgi:hypothetical protein